MTAQNRKIHVAIGKFGDFLCTPQWVVVGGMLVAISALFPFEVAMVAASVLERDVIRRDPLVALPQNLAMIVGVALLNLRGEEYSTRQTGFMGRMVRVMRLDQFLLGIIGGLACLQVLKFVGPGRLIPTLWERFSLPTIAVMLVLQAIVLMTIYVVSNYSSGMVQVLRVMTSEAATNEVTIRNLNAALVTEHRRTLREVASHLHGHVQGSLVRLAMSIKNVKLTQEINTIVETVIRPVAHSLYPAELAVSLGAALGQLCGSRVVYRPTERFVALEVDRDINLPIELKESIYYVALESTTNALKHGVPGTIELHIDADDSVIALTVVNDDPSPSPENRRIQPRDGSIGLWLIDSELASRSGSWSLSVQDGVVELRATFPRADA